MKNNDKKVYPERSRRVIIAMSGGVDSSVSAALLKEAGFDVVGIFMKCWSEEEVKTGVCTAEEDERWARRAALKIGIPFYTVDLVKEYREKVVEYFVREYEVGLTPNPDVMCNKEIKFGLFYDMAMREFGADLVATGHYSRVKNGKLLKGKDPNKDQSYFLWAIEGSKLKNVLFPIGEYRKTKVRILARKFNLPNAERKDSQGICFIGKVDVGNFLHEYISDSPGAIVNSDGREVGQHRGLHFYTIGQRKGISIGGGPPYYVSSKDYSSNTLLVSREYDDELFCDNLVASNLNWITDRPKLPFRGTAKIRYRQPDQKMVLEKVDNDGSISVEFKEPQRAITSGQSIVFYKGDELIGGGIIK